MAIAPINNVREVLEYALTELPPEKILLGIPNYSYDWPLPYERGVTEADTGNNIDVLGLASDYGSAIIFDQESKSPYFNYTDGENIEHVVWFEDVSSLEAKYDLVIEKNLLGCGFWHIGNPFPQCYLLLCSKFDVIKYPEEQFS